MSLLLTFSPKLFNQVFFLVFTSVLFCTPPSRCHTCFRAFQIRYSLSTLAFVLSLNNEKPSS